MSYLYVALQSSADRAARSDTALPGTIARPDSEITTSTVVVQVDLSRAEYFDGPIKRYGELR